MPCETDSAALTACQDATRQASKRLADARCRRTLDARLAAGRLLVNQMGRVASRFLLGTTAGTLFFDAAGVGRLVAGNGQANQQQLYFVPKPTRDGTFVILMGDGACLILRTGRLEATVVTPALYQDPTFPDNMPKSCTWLVATNVQPSESLTLLPAEELPAVACMCPSADGTIVRTLLSNQPEAAEWPPTQAALTVKIVSVNG